jgi:ankyrin repeat protein
LISKQASDGTWHVASRMTSPADVSPPYFETGFPYQHDQFISYAGTNWALMALLAAIDKPVSVRSDKSSQQTALVTAQLPGFPVYARAALFGTSAELEKLLHSGLDPNQQTSNGTTLLMMAASDAAKVKLLLSRGAKVKTRARSGVDALTVAASYYGNAASISALLGAGAEAEVPDGVKSAHSPLGLATMSGDLEAVKLLLAHGADPAAGYPLGEAITFNHPQIAEALIKAGSSADAVESTGVNLLHWATITNRPALIPVLVKAGVPLNDVDENGYTPLMYAAEIDFGDTRVLNALLAAKADTQVKDRDGKTALQHAQTLKHREIEKVLAGK